ncbi:hypothetical protein [Rhizobium sp. 768_B6_N1_8]
MTIGGWVTLFLGCALWPLVLIWAYVGWLDGDVVAALRNLSGTS